jgi:hypothetical protein
MSNVTITLSLDQIKASLPAELSPVIDNALSVFSAWAPSEAAAWLALAKSDANTARSQLLDAMTDAGRTTQLQADVIALGQVVSDAADYKAKWDALLKQCWQVLLVLASSALAVA